MLLADNLFSTIISFISTLFDAKLLTVFFILGLVLVVATFVKLLIHYKQVLAERVRLRGYLDVISENFRMEEIQNGDFDYAIKALSRSLVTSLNVDNANYWEYDEEEQCLKLHASGKGFNHRLKRKTEVIPKSQFPNYIEWFESGTIFYSSSIQGSELVEDIFASLYAETPYQSSMACPVILEGKLAGIVACESKKKRLWREDDLIVIKAIAANISQAYRSVERHNLILEMEKQQQYIQEMNVSLEQQVVVGAKEVESVNEKLAEYAYINAHKMRGPICRLLGLNKLLGTAKSENEILEIGSHLKSSIGELNEMTSHSSDILEESNYYKDFIKEKRDTK